MRLFSHLVSAERLVSVMINLPAARSAPGRIVRQRHGIIAVPAGGNGDDLVALFAHAEIEAIGRCRFPVAGLNQAVQQQCRDIPGVDAAGHWSGLVKSTAFRHR